MRQFVALTRKQKAALAALASKHRQFPANTYGFWARTIGAGNAAACRRLEETGLVVINRVAENCFRYALSENGKERERANGGSI